MSTFGAKASCHDCASQKKELTRANPPSLLDAGPIMKSKEDHCDSPDSGVHEDGDPMRDYLFGDRAELSDQFSSDNEMRSDLDELKKVTARLRLDTRRPSIVEWMALRQSRSLGGHLAEPPPQDTPTEAEDPWTPARVNAINDALDWLRKELQEMRRTDQKLARQLISLRADLHRLKLAKSCTEHAALIEDVALALDEREEMSELCDLPLPLPSEPLKELGVTRMHFSSSARRFSLC